MADLFGEMELAQGAGISGYMQAPGGVNLSGLPNVGGQGTPGMRSGKQRLAVNNLHKGAPNPFQQQPEQAAQAGYGQSQQQQYAPQQAFAQAQAVHPGVAMQQQGLASHEKAIEATNRAWQQEMDSRVSQARDQDRMAHEQSLASMKYQSEMAGHQANLAAQQQQTQSRDARNSALMRAAGIGRHTIVNGRKVGGFGPLRQSLLG